MKSNWTVRTLPLGLLLVILSAPAAAGSQDAYVVPRLVTGNIDGVIFTPTLSFKNLSSKPCEGKFLLFEGDFNPAEGVFEFNGLKITAGVLPVSLRPGEGLSGKLKKVDAGGYAGFGFWRQDSACTAGQDLALTADVEVRRIQADNEYRIVDQIGFTASAHPSTCWGFAARKTGTAASGDSTAFAVVPGEPGPFGWTVKFFPESGIGQLSRQGTTSGPLTLFIHEVFGQDLPTNFTGYVTVSADKPVHLEALTVAWGGGVQGGIQYSNFPVQADAAIPYTREISAATLQQTLDQIRSDNKIVGVSAAVVVRGHLVWTGVSGSSHSGVPITSDMYFDIGSAAKNFVAALVLKLSEEGLLGLEDPIGKWLPTFKYVDERVTIRQLLGHTSGISTYTTNPNFWYTVFVYPNRVWTPEDVLSYIGPPDFPPGTSWNYSNTNYTLLGMIARKAAGSSLSGALRSRLLDPLGLTDTFLQAEESVPGTLAHAWFDMNSDGAYEDVSGMNRTSQVSAAWGAGGMVSTAPDVARWACALFEGKVLSADSLNQMLGFRELFIPLSPIVGCGLGALRALLLGREYWGHGGNMIGYSTIMLYAPKERVSIALLFNQDFIDYAVGAKLLDSFIAAVVG